MKTELLLKHFLRHRLVTTDTRKITQNAIFFALKGEKFNGNLFAKEALDKGASIVVVDEPQNLQDDRIILVKNGLESLQALARAYRSTLRIPVIGLTGSNGKTTSKELIAAVLQEKFQVHYTQGNLNNHIGVPLTLLSIPENAQIAVIEMGANHLKEIELLSSIAQPDLGYVTNFGHAHLEGFGGFEGVVKGKSELYNFLYVHHKTVLINADDPLQLQQAKAVESQISFSKNESTQATYCIELKENVNNKIQVVVEDVVIRSNLTGNYNWSNVAAAISFGKHFGLSLKEIKNGIENYYPANHRSQLIQKDKYTLLMDAYNANPSSMEASLNNFSTFDGSKTVILGDMFELGESSKVNHQKIAQLTKDLSFEKIYLVGNNFSKIEGDFSDIQFFEDRDSLVNYLKKHPIETKNILIKGSHGMRLDLLENEL
ncbi:MULTISPECIES: UDP-N-acetylmuramoyl-tripeptide--D-alanyl-D-alanine ligase [Weeksella]|uniref:UDP-N-acetylmuramoyl-tripeptide--D-alanyl-D- alanine ligase n=1 Tax=Weeksella TaxID=1013 RepID=UPI0008A43DBA|nr:MULTISPECIES: UDP-N-acetylmuramoyl-tripeptide--D-alanyl-D-alanine ligase [Weeksella]MDK7375718.1 UDP-N-acetylmuramoyl-tripeptide--D-alanyl-D-alanine ligase [Weeksella virosa]OFM84183.1 UDP-N-acetylmuramoyl-tripeptide--D-alanyl-D-alanine ligase [Weeksella sp. HMSC059D05]